MEWLEASAGPSYTLLGARGDAVAGMIGQLGDYGLWEEGNIASGFMQRP